MNQDQNNSNIDNNMVNNNQNFNQQQVNNINPISQQTSQFTQQPVNDFTMNNQPMSKESKKSKLGLIIGIISIVIIIIICILIMFVFSNKNTSNNNESASKNEESITTKEETTKKDTETINKDYLKRTYKVPLKDIYIDVPDYSSLEAGFSKLFVDFIRDMKAGAIKVVATRCDQDQKVETVEEAFQINATEFVNDMRSYYLTKSYKVTSHETVTINGREFYKVIGSISRGSEAPYDCYMVSYSCVMDDLPVSIFGIVMEREQRQEQIDEINRIVELSAQSVRTQK